MHPQSVLTESRRDPPPTQAGPLKIVVILLRCGSVRESILSAKLFKRPGEVSERFKEHAWKACVGEILPWVRIPPSPPSV
jgi:hypothetical protein